jgi:hypothetical protein
MDRTEQQIDTENTYGKQHLGKLVTGNARDLMQDTLETILEACRATIEDWARLPYYPSKQKRLESLTEDSTRIDRAVIAVVLAILPCQGNMTIQQATGKVANYLDWYEDEFDAIKTAAEILVICAQQDLIEMDQTYGETILVSHNWPLNRELELHINRMMFLPPMICEPKEVTSNKGTGYLTFEESVILGRENHHSKKVSLDVLNIINQVSLSIEPEALVYEEKPNKLLEEPEQVIAFEAMRDASREVYNYLMGASNQFWLTHKFDKRGRLYSIGYHLHLQSTQYKKSLIEFTKKELIT